VYGSQIGIKKTNRSHRALIGQQSGQNRNRYPFPIIFYYFPYLTSMKGQIEVSPDPCLFKSLTPANQEIKSTASVQGHGLLILNIV
jgi:hypothetical protein